MAFRLIGKTLKFASRSRGALPSALPKRSRTRWARRTTIAVGASGLSLAAVGMTLDDPWTAARHSGIAAERSGRIAQAVVASVVDYKFMFQRSYEGKDQYARALSECHSRSAQRVLKAILANGGVYVKLGQHMSSMYLLPLEWTQPMRILQDRCEPTPFKEVEALVLDETGRSLESWFSYFDPEPIGIASLAQVHRAVLRDTGEEVAVKIQHPSLREFVDVDIKVTSASLEWVRRLFPDFELDWLGAEMRENLPKELDFIHESRNAARIASDFQDCASTVPLHVPRVLASSPRFMVMEFINGGRVDDLEYLARHSIDRNQVALAIQEVFVRMVHVYRFFHADPHAGNLLIRPAQQPSRHKYNFDVVLLDHGLCYDLDAQLADDYSRMWLALIRPATQANLEKRRYYAIQIGTPPELYPIFQTAITGRAALEGAWGSSDAGTSNAVIRAGSLLELKAQSAAEKEAIRAAVLQDGLIVGVFAMLRHLPRRVVMILKLNDLVRNLDSALQTTHSKVRIFTITARYCAWAAWRDDWTRFRARNLTLASVAGCFASWWEYQSVTASFRLLELALDTQGWLVKQRLWWHGLWRDGLRGARLEAAGLLV
ncbi:ABC1-domain-containing protein [Auriculariales sp. MPI-PUGE-AT-0066]|nr:ABC1-domain-containing protein [Auriculariales sp. MPI-PUGE-AT-0066]